MSYHVWGPPQRPTRRPNLSVILPDLLVGEYPTPHDAAWLRAVHGIGAVVSLQDDADLASKGVRLRELEHAYRDQGMHFHRIPVPDCDTDTLTARLDESLGVLGALLAGGCRVYLHCNAGMNRAPTIAIAYLHAAQGLSLAAARDLVKQRRYCVPYMRVLEAHFGRRA
jgi:protein-tyrosine phosphatase